MPGGRDSRAGFALGIPVTGTSDQPPPTLIGAPPANLALVTVGGVLLAFACALANPARARRVKTYDPLIN